jgi:type IV pilus assembly protein PilQ
MRTLRYLSLLGLFAAVGVALAIGLAVGTAPQPPEPISHPTVDNPAEATCGASRLACPTASSALPDKPAAAPVPSNSACRAGSESLAVENSGRCPGGISPQLLAGGAESTAPVPAVKPAAAGDTKSFHVQPIEREDSEFRQPVAAVSPEPAAIELKLAPPPVRTPAAASSDPPLPPAVTALVAAQPNPRQGAQPINQKQLDALMQQLQKMQQKTATPETVPPPVPNPDPQPAPNSNTAAKSRAQRIKGEISRAPGSGEGDDRLSIVFPETDVREILDHLAEFGRRNILVSKNVQGRTSVRLNDVSFDSALEAILKSSGLASRRDQNFIYVGTPEEFNSMEQAQDRIDTRVYRPNYVAAADLQTLITPLLTEKVGAISVSAPAEAGIPADGTAAGGNKFAGGEVVMVRDYKAVLAQIDAVVAEVDVRPMQVAIEAMILSCTLDDTDTLGVNLEFLRNNPNVRLSLGSPSESIPSPLPGPGLQFAYLDSNLSAFVNALQSVADTNVIATPRLMVINRQRAEIQIGRKQGYFSSTSQTETSTTQSVNFLETGTILRLRPFISSDGLIRMEVHPELSTGDLVVLSNQVLPDSDVTQVTTNVIVHDGCTVIIGGLIREELDTTNSQVPFFGSLPVIGPAFQNKTETTSRHEILILLTPHIVYEPDSCQEGEKAACEFHRRQAVAAEKMSPWGKRYVGRKYFRLAQNAWAAGDRPTALRFAEMSVQFDPLNRAAIDLRANIWQNRAVGDHTIPPAAEVQAAVNPLEGQQIPDWLLSDLEHAPEAPVTPLHPLDPGQPGRHTDIPRPRQLP